MSKRSQPAISNNLSKKSRTIISSSNSHPVGDNSQSSSLFGDDSHPVGDNSQSSSLFGADSRPFGEVLIFNNVYKKTEFTDFSIKSKTSSTIFYVHKYDIIKNSNVLKDFIIDDKSPIIEIELDYSETDIYLFLKSFCSYEHDGKIIESSYIPSEKLSTLIPIYHKYDMKNQLNKCRNIIKNVTSMTCNLVNVIMNTPGFKNEKNIVMSLLESEKITGDFLQYIPKEDILNRLLINKSNYQQYKKKIKNRINNSLEKMTGYKNANTHREEFCRAYNNST